MSASPWRQGSGDGEKKFRGSPRKSTVLASGGKFDSILLCFTAHLGVAQRGYFLQ